MNTFAHVFKRHNLEYNASPFEYDLEIPLNFTQKLITEVGTSNSSKYLIFLFN